MKVIFLFFIITILLTSCTFNQSTTDYELILINEGCLNKTASLIINEDNNYYYLNGIIELPNPCYDFSKKIKQIHKTLEIYINTEPTDDFCIQCIGALSVKGKFSKKYYNNIKLYLNNKLLIEK